MPEPAGELDPRYSSEGVSAHAWAEAEAVLEEAELFWVSTVRPDRRPHVTPVLAVWHEGALHFGTGPGERKAHNLAENPHVVLTTGVNSWTEGYDVVVEGDAVRVTDEGRLRVLAAAWEAKYGPRWHYEVRDGCFQHEPGPAYVYAVAPHTVFGFGKGEPFSQTRWRFGCPSRGGPGGGPGRAFTVCCRHPNTRGPSSRCGSRPTRRRRRSNGWWPPAWPARPSSSGRPPLRSDSSRRK